MSKFYIRVNALFEVLMLLLGLWTFYAQVCVLARVPFATIRTFSFLPILVSAFMYWKFSSLRQSFDVSASDAPRKSLRPFRAGVVYFGAPIVIAAIYAITHSNWLFWLLAIIYLTAVAWFGQQDERKPREAVSLESRFEIGILLVLCLMAGFFTSATRRPDDDDSYYLNIANASIEFPYAAPQRFDALHRGGLPPVEQMLHLPETYELMVGLLASLSGVSVSILYYIILPPFWAVLSTLANWLALRHFLRPREATWGTAIFIFILFFWGDGHQTFGNFGFVRLFQGKSIYIMVALPFIVLSALRYRQQPNITTWFRLALSQVVAVGLTTNGMVVAPLAAALAIVARPNFDFRSLRTMFIGVAASLPLAIVASAMYVQMAPYLSSTFVSADVILLSYSTTLGAERAPLILLVLILLPVLALHTRLKHADWIAGYVWVVVFVIFLPLALALATRILGNAYSWRLFWAIPVSLLVSLAGGIAAGGIRMRRWRLVIALAAWAVAFELVGPLAVSSNVFSLNNIGRLKVNDAQYAVAEKTLALARVDAPALVPESIAIYMATFPHTPPLICVRPLYLEKMRGFIPDKELAMRLALCGYSTDINPAMSADDALKAIDADDIATVVFPMLHRDNSTLVVALTARGFVVRTMNNFVIAIYPK